jgi:hypothetical protein
MIKEEFIYNTYMDFFHNLIFLKKEKKLIKILKSFPEERTGIQTFLTNRHIVRKNLK